MSVFRPGSEMESIFTGIYRANAWGSAASVSGPGSTRERAKDFVTELVEAIRSLGARTLLDAPCGDFTWAAPIADAVEGYVGIDVVRELVRANQRLHGSPRRRFRHLDLARDRLPPSDVILCRDCLVHFSHADARRALANFRRSGSRHLIATTFVGNRENEDIATGGWRCLNLQRPPFDFPEPLALVDERCSHSGGIYADKRLGIWRIGDLPE